MKEIDKADKTWRSTHTYSSLALFLTLVYTTAFTLRHMSGAHFGKVSKIAVDFKNRNFLIDHFFYFFRAKRYTIPFDQLILFYRPRYEHTHEYEPRTPGFEFLYKTEDESRKSIAPSFFWQWENCLREPESKMKQEAIYMQFLIDNAERFEE